jgi:hypothetical protein
MVISIKNTNQKNYVSFMPHAFSQSEHSFVNVDTLVKLNLLKNHDFL